jgi:cyclic beta-1,2-glucan synthetase
MTFADALTGAWPVLSGAVNFARGRAAAENALRSLEKERMVLLLEPPFGESSKPFPGRIADYPPGTRENGGQYSHGASWLVDALAHLSRMAEENGDAAESRRLRGRAMEVWIKISPLGNLDNLEHFGLPPHQQAADVSSNPGTNGRGGWSWYTGAAARMLSAAYAILGLHFENGEIVLSRDAFDATGPVQLKRITFRRREYR